MYTRYQFLGAGTLSRGKGAASSPAARAFEAFDDRHADLATPLLARFRAIASLIGLPHRGCLDAPAKPNGDARLFRHPFTPGDAAPQ
jgi:hypothetical protein